MHNGVTNETIICEVNEIKKKHLDTIKHQENKKNKKMFKPIEIFRKFSRGNFNLRCFKKRGLLKLVKNIIRTYHYNINSIFYCQDKMCLKLRNSYLFCQMK